MLLARAVSFPSLLLVLCQVKQERRYAYSTTLVSQSVSQEKIDNFAFFVKFLFLLYRRSRVFLWLATADMASL